MQETATRHATVALDYHGQPVEIDTGIAPLIRALWSRGIETSGSCEDWATSGDDVGRLPAGRAMVCVADPHDARRFARTCRGARAVDPTVRIVYPDASELAQAQAEGIRFGAFLVFPADRIPGVTERLRGER